MKKRFKGVSFFTMSIIILMLLSACGGQNKLKIHFDSNQGSPVNSIVTDGNSAVKLPKNPTKEGYDFEGWFYDNVTFEMPFESDSLLLRPIASDLTVYAKWVAKLPSFFTVTFEVNGGTSIDPIRIQPGSTLSLPTDPIKIGFFFDSWYTDIELTNEFLPDASFIFEDITLYAKWDSYFDLVRYPNEDFYTIRGFSNAYSPTSPVLIIPSEIDGIKVGRISFEAFNNSKASNITELVFEEDSSLVEIGDEAFSGLSNLTKIELPNQLQTIGYKAFYNNSLQEITLPSSLKTLGGYAFSDNKLNKVVFMGDVIEMIGNSAFSDNENLYDIKFPNEVNQLGLSVMYNTKWLSSTEIAIIGTTVFRYNGNNSSYEIPEGIKVIASEAFKDNKNLRRIVFPATLQEVQSSAFLGCSNLTSVIFTAETLPKLGSYVFYNTTSSLISGLRIGLPHQLHDEARAVWNNNGFNYNNYKDLITESSVVSYSKGDSMTNGEVPASQYFLPGDTVNIRDSHTLSKSNMVFDHWTDGYSKYEAGSSYQLNLSLYLTPVWKDSTATITFDLQGGVGSFTHQVVEFGTKIGVLPVPTKSDNIFLGWYTEIRGGENITDSSISAFSGNLTLYARWQLTITLDLQGGSSSVTSFTMHFNEMFEGLPIPTKAGSTFDGWYTSIGGQGVQIKDYDPCLLSGHSTIYAKWIVTITFDSQNGSSVGSKNVTFNDSIGEIETPKRTGYDFLGWFTEPNGLGQKYDTNTIFEGSSTITLFAFWTEIEVTLTFNYQGGSGDITTKSVAYNQIIGDLPVPTKANNTFVGWFTTSSNGYQIEATATSGFTQNAQLFARWEMLITLDYQGGLGNDSIVVMRYGEKISGLPVSANKEGNTFGGWYTNEGGNGTKVSNSNYCTLGGHTTLYAKWTTVIVFDSQSGSNVSNKTVTYKNTIGTLPIPDRMGYTFDAWYEHPNAMGHKIESTSIYNHEGSMTVYANWIANSYTVTFNYQGATDGNSITDQVILYNSIFGVLPNPIKAESSANYSFDGWYTQVNGQGLLITKDSIYSFGNDIILYANWVNYEMILSVDPSKMMNGFFAINETGDINPDYFGAKAIDSDGNSFTVNATIRIGNRIAGNVLSIRLTATDKYGTTQTIDLNNSVKVYGMPTISSYNDSIKSVKVTDELNAEFFSATAKDYFNNPIFCDVYVDQGEFQSGHIVTVRIIATDIVGNTVYVDIENIKVYGEISFTYDEAMDAISYEDTIDPNLFNVKAYDAFGTPLSVYGKAQYTVYFSVGDLPIKSPDPQVISATKGLIYPDIPACQGYVFQGWYEKGKSIPFDFSSHLTSDKILYAKWSSIGSSMILTRNTPVNVETNTTGKTYVFVALYSGQATFSTTNSTAVTNIQLATNSQFYNLISPVSFRTNGMNIVKTYDVTAGTVYYVRVTSSINGSASLSVSGSVKPKDGGLAKAAFNYYNGLKQATVNFNSNGGNENIPSQIVTANQGLTYPVIPTRNDHVFAGWYMTSDGKGQPYDFTRPINTESITLFAKWIAIQTGRYFPMDLGTTAVSLPSNESRYYYYVPLVSQTLTVKSSSTVQIRVYNSNLEMIAGKSSIVSNPNYTFEVIAGEVYFINVYQSSNFNGNISLEGTKLPESGGKVEIFSTVRTTNLVDIGFFAKDAFGNEGYILIKDIEIYDRPEIILTNPQVDYKEGETVTLETLGVTAFDTFNKDISASLLLEVLMGNSTSGNMMSFRITATDRVGNTTAREVSVRFYGTPTITYDEDKKGVKIDDTISAGLFEALGFDSFGNSLSVSTKVVSGNLISGTYISVNINVTDIVGNTHSVTIDNIGVYDINDLLLAYNAALSNFIANDSKGSEFGVDSLDSFGNKAHITISILSGTLNNLCSVQIIASDLAGNTKSSEIIHNIYLYDATLYFDYQGADSGNEEVSRKVMANNQIGILPNPTKSGYYFDGWFTTPSTGGNLVLEDTLRNHQTAILYARYTKIPQYTISFDVDGGNQISPITQDYGSVLTEPTTVKTGYTFDGWYLDAGKTQAFTFDTMPGNNISLYAKWQINKYTISFESNGGNEIELITQDYGTSIMTPVTTKIGYSFAGWYIDEALSTKSTLTKMPAENLTLYAKWTIKSFTITFNSNGGSPISPITQNFDTIVNEPIPIKAGYTFGGWFIDYQRTQLYTFSSMPANNLTLYAEWTIRTYTIYYADITSEYYNDESIPINAGEKIVQTALGGDHSFVLTSFGRMFAWGNNEYGQLGDGTTIVRGKPVEITSNFNLREDERIVKIAAGTHHSSAITSDGRMFMWGMNLFYQLGDLTKVNKSVPTDITSLFGLTSQEKIVDLALGYGHSAALSSNGRIFTWGNNEYGQRGQYIYEHEPTDLTPQLMLIGDEVVAKIAVGERNTAAITSNGRLFIWGSNLSGELGIGTTGYYREVPMDMASNFNLETGEVFVNVAIGGYHCIAITSFGRVFTWGSNGEGQLGDGTKVSKSIPTDITSNFGFMEDEKPVMVSLGLKYSAILTSRQRTFIWGDNQFGQLGIGEVSDNDKLLPIDVSSNFYFYTLNEPRDIAYIELGNYHGAAVNSSGRIFTWGANDKGQLGEGSYGLNVKRYAPYYVNFYTPLNIDSEMKQFGSTIFGIYPTKTGYTFDGWYLDHDLTQRYTFSKMPAQNLSLYAKWSLNQYTITFNTNGGTYLNPIKQYYGTEVAEPKASKTGSHFLGWYTDPLLTNEYHFNTMQAEDLTLYAKWENIQYTITYGYITSDYKPNSQLPLYPGETMIQIAIGESHSIAVTSLGRVFTWGSNTYGQLGNNSFTSSNKPINITSNFYGAKIIQVSAGYYHSMALSDNGRVFVWGDNQRYQIGDGTKNLKATPYEITSSFSLSQNEKITQIEASGINSAILTSNNRTFMWGTSVNNYRYFTPYDLSSTYYLNDNDRIIQLDLSEGHFGFLTNSGSVYLWGSNYYGQVGGSQSTTYVETPQIFSIGNFNLQPNEKIIKIALGRDHTSALSSNGRIFTMGSNSLGQLADTTVDIRSYPQDVTASFALNSGEIIVKIFTGANSNMAVTSLGRIFAWGDNSKGQFGNGTTNTQTLPINVTTYFGFSLDEQVTDMSLGDGHQIVMTSKGRVFVWGNNGYGQLGDYTSRSTLQPVVLPIYKPEILKVVTYEYYQVIASYTPNISGYKFSGWYLDYAFVYSFNHSRMLAQDLYAIAKITKTS